MNPLHPNRMTTEERRAEIVSLLAAAVIRLRTRQSTELSPQSAHNRLDSASTPRMHVPTDHPGAHA